MQRRLTGMTVGLAAGITAAVATASAAGAYLYSVHHYEGVLETARRTALVQGNLVRAALEHEMMEGDRGLIREMIEAFGRQPGVARVLLLDRTGGVRYANSPAAAEQFELGDPTCQACHRLPSEERASSQVIEADGGALLRTVVAFPNDARCHECHDPRRTINGVLILDHDAGAMRAAIGRDLRWMLAGTGGLAALLIGALAFTVRVAVLRKLRRFEQTARQIAEGDLERRVPAEGSDTVAWLAREFNTMADSVTGLLDRVRGERERLETVINSIDDGIVVLDAQRNVIAANDSFLRRTGRVRDDVLGCCCQDLRPGMCTAEHCPTLECLQSGQRYVRLCEREAADGTIRWEEVHASPIRDTTGTLLQVVEVWRDISDRRAAEARLAESHRLASLGLLASGFSHELNTPLATVLTCVESILREAQGRRSDGPDVGRIGDTAAIAREQLLRCRGITQHFLRMSRGQPSAGGIVPLRGAVAAVGRLIEPTARTKSIDVRVELPDADLHVWADEADLQHALINLLLNAVQACRAGGRVRLAVHGGESVRIRVSDNGCGIPLEHQKRIFEPFFSLRQGGTGLGLFLSLNFVRQWGGDIVLESSPGRGSTFEMVLPVLAPGARQAAS
jgi:PAS domain S-box-containing protein